MARSKNPRPNETRGRNKESQKVALFTQYYTDPKSSSWNNIRQSALRAGYSESYANNITTLNPAWFEELQEQIGNMKQKMLAKAERNIDKYLEVEDLSLQSKASFFVSERIGKADWSTRQEVTGANGRRLFNESDKEKAQIPLKSLFKGVKSDA